MKITSVYSVISIHEKDVLLFDILRMYDRPGAFVLVERNENFNDVCIMQNDIIRAEIFSLEDFNGRTARWDFITIARVGKTINL